MGGEPFARVIVDVSGLNGAREFHYAVPPQLNHEVRPGCQVWCSFGGRPVKGWVTARDKELPLNLDTSKLQPILAASGQWSIPADLMALVLPMAEELLISPVEILDALSPPGVKARLRQWICLKSASQPHPFPLDGWDPVAASMVDRLKRSPGKRLLQSTLLKGIKNHGRAALQRLISCGMVEVCHDMGFKYGSAAKLKSSPKGHVSNPLQLTSEQAAAVERIIEYMQQKNSQTVLLHGVTGSGKTEVYLELINIVLHSGRGAILLVPEIALTAQLQKRLLQRFGEQVAVLHSGLGVAERREYWRRLATGQVPIAIGARSAVFAPVHNLGLIILDEEHDSAYFQEQSPKYHARDIAVKRAKLTGATIVLGSATPLVESYYRSQQGQYLLVEMSKRVHRQIMPEIYLVDLRRELALGNRGLLSELLRIKLQERLNKGEQTILYLNRRGYHTFVVCRECGFVIECPHCAVAMVYHKEDQSLHCHYCQTRQANLQHCPRCGGKAIRYFGTGTQKVEEELQRMFPGIGIVRMDRDTADKDGPWSALEPFRKGQAQVLVGTQMIAKGLNFPGVTLVGVLAADASLFLPDYRASERTFSLLTQVAGRAGRGDKAGQVIFQTYNPEHFCIQRAQSHDYQGFYRQELGVRHSLFYPPFGRLARIIIFGSLETEVAAAASNWGQNLRALNKYSDLDIWGPVAHMVYRVAEQYRQVITLRSRTPDRNDLQPLIKEALGLWQQIKDKSQQVYISIAFNPMD